MAGLARAKGQGKKLGRPKARIPVERLVSWMGRRSVLRPHGLDVALDGEAMEGAGLVDVGGRWRSRWAGSYISGEPPSPYTR